MSVAKPLVGGRSRRLDAQRRRDLLEGGAFFVVDGDGAPAHKVAAFLAGLGGLGGDIEQPVLVAGGLLRRGLGVQQLRHVGQRIKGGLFGARCGGHGDVVGELLVGVRPAFDGVLGGADQRVAEIGFAHFHDIGGGGKAFADGFRLAAEAGGGNGDGGGAQAAQEQGLFFGGIVGQHAHRVLLW